MSDPQIDPADLKIRIHAVPVPQPRTKVSSFGGRARAYTPTTIGSKEAGTKRPHPILHFKNCVAQQVSQLFDGAPWTCPIAARMTFVLPRPTNMIWKTKPMPRVPETRHNSGDVDNQIKGVFDALNKLLFADDSQIFSIAADKWIAAGDEQPHVVLEFWKVEPESAA